MADAAVTIAVAGGDDDRAREACLRRLHAGSGARDVEILIVDGAAAQPQRLLGAVAGARSPLVLLLDDRLEPDSALVEAHLEAHRALGDGTLAHGPVLVEPRTQTHALARWERDESRRRARLLEAAQPPRPADVRLWNTSVQRETLLAAGLPDASPALAGVALATRVGRVAAAPAARATMPYEASFRAAAAAVQRTGAEAAALARAEPALLPHLPIATFGTGDIVLDAARRLLLAARVPSRLLAGADAVLGAKAPLLVHDVLLWQGVRRADADLWRRLSRGPLILMYHAFGDGEEPPSRFVVPARSFERQLRVAQLLRRRLISLDEVAAARAEQRLPPAGAVVVTIDDGYADNAAVALPILRRRHAPATVFAVSTTAAGGGAPGARGLLQRPLLGPEQLRRLAAAGVAIGAHTRTHADLTELDGNELADEVEGSKAELESVLGAPVSSFAYPYGRADERARAAVRAAGFGLACGIERGFNDPGTPLDDLRRVEVDGRASLLRFALALWLGDPEAPERLRAAVATRLRRARTAAPVRE